MQLQRAPGISSTVCKRRGILWLHIMMLRELPRPLQREGTEAHHRAAMRLRCSQQVVGMSLGSTCLGNFCVFCKRHNTRSKAQRSAAMQLLRAAGTSSTVRGGGGKSGSTCLGSFRVLCKESMQRSRNSDYMCSCCCCCTLSCITMSCINASLTAPDTIYTKSSCCSRCYSGHSPNRWVAALVYKAL
jgi:hypothetical protein